MLRYEVLKPEEWGELEGLKGDPVPIPQAQISSAVVARNEQNEIVGRVYLVWMPTEMGTWVREDYRGKTVLSGLQKKLESTMKEAGMPTLFACIRHSHFADYARRKGFNRTPWRQWVKRIICHPSAYQQL